MACPNINLDSWKLLVAARGENVAYALWDLYEGNVPESESKSSIVKAGLKSVDALQSEKAIKLFSSLEKNRVKGDAFWNKVQSDLSIPKDQIELLKSFNTTDRNELITNMLANYSYAIEINVAKNKIGSDIYGKSSEPKQITDENSAMALGAEVGDYFIEYITEDGDPDIAIFKTLEEANRAFNTQRAANNSSVYSNLTVPGGTNYTENEIATPAITPSIKGHAQFATDQGIGWFRSDDSIVGIQNRKALPQEIEEVRDTEGAQAAKELEKNGIPGVGGTPTTTRRILEVQSDLFQKGRDSKVLSKKLDIKKVGDTFISNGEKFTVTNIDTDSNLYELITISNQEGKTATLRRSALEKRFDERGDNSSDNQFLQLLNKNSNWVTFFIKSILQDSAKKGYEKVLFPSGNTASKVEGHTTLEEFKKQKENRIKELEESSILKNKNVDGFYYIQRYLEDENGNEVLTWRKVSNETGREKTATKEEIESLKSKFSEETKNEINQLKKELEDVEKNGFGALKPIYNFYENTVKNILNKQYGKDNVKQITDEYGNTWNEVEIVPEREQKQILLQKEGMPASKASAETLSKVKEAAKKMGISIQQLSDYLKGNKDVTTKGINGLADLVRGIIAVAEGKEDVALTEEMVHVATAILEQMDPRLVTEMISKIDRFKIYKQVYDQYKDVYKLPNGKPDIRKIKKEAVDKLLVEVIINKAGATEAYPELMEEATQSLFRNFWNKILDLIRGVYRKSNISIFEEVGARVIEGEVGGTISDISEGGIFYQLSDAQKKVQEKIQETRNSINKVVSDEKSDEVLADSDESTNWYEISLPDGTKQKITKRVTDLVKEWYKKRFKDKKFTPEEKAFNEMKRKYGVEGHADFEEIHNRYYNKDGTKKTTPDPRPVKFNLPSEEMYNMLENYYVSLLQTLDKDALVFSEVIVYNPKDKRAGTIDFLAVDPSGKGHILDWKFMQINGEDVAWFKQGAFDIQLGTYKNILKDFYGIKEFGMNRAIPIAMDFGYKEKGNKSSGLELKGIAIGSIDKTKIQDLRLVPVSEQTESTGYEDLDNIIKKLNSMLKQIGKEEVTDDDERLFKIERLNTIRKAVRLLQGQNNIASLIDVVGIMREEGDQLLNDYNTIYKNRPASSNDSNNKELSDFAEKMRVHLRIIDVFENIGRDIGHLVYTKDMLENAKTEEEREDVARRKDIHDQLMAQSNAIYRSKEQLTKAAQDFADKHVGQRNLVFGLLSPEAVIKGLSSNFRGISELPSKALQLLYKVVRGAQGEASKASLERVQKLMDIRKKLAEQGGDLRTIVQQIYQKDDKGGIVNKLIHRYSRKFHEEVDAKAKEGGDKQWLLDNIDVEEYKKEANKRLEDQIKKIERQIYTSDKNENEAIRVKNIKEAQEMWDIDNKNFNGWNNYIIKRHPLPKWYSEEYKNILKNPILLELYNFIGSINEEAKEAGYITNKVMKTFLPFVRKGAAEELAWDHSISPLKNFSESLKMQTDDVGFGSFNELTGELENSVPKYYTYDFTRKDGVNDYSDVSEDLFKNMILYIQQMEKYKYLSAVEGQLQLVKTVEQFKGHLATDRSANVVKQGGKIIEIPGNEENTKMYDDFLRVLLYGQKYVLSDTDTPLNVGKVLNFVKNGVNTITGREVFKIDEEPSATSLVKTMDAANRAFQLKALGFEFISGAVNMFGGNIQVATQAGDYFKARDFLKNQAKLAVQRFDNEEDREIFVQLVNTFMPLKDDPSTDIYKYEAGMTALTRKNLGDMLMVFMRKPEQLIEKSIFVTLLENMMVDNGRIVNINDFVKNKYKNRYKSSSEYKQSKEAIKAEVEELKKTKSIAVTKKLVNGKLEIPGLDLSNQRELQRLTELTRRISRNATGGMSDGDINRMSMSVWTNSMMLFKSWIPKLADTRFSEFRKVSDDFSVTVDEDGVKGEKYDIGRIRLLAYVLGTSIRDKSANITNLIQMNDKGIALIDKMYEDFAEKYEKRTGETLNMTKEDFADMIRTNLRNEIKELAILGALLGVMISLGFMAPDDEEDKATKNFFRYSQRVVDKFVGELSFFYNPVNFESLLSGSMFPAIGLITDYTRFTSHFVREVTGFDITDPTLSAEEVRKKAMPIKYAAKALPVAKSALTYGAILNNEFAKEFDITIQKESSMK